MMRGMAFLPGVKISPVRFALLLGLLIFAAYPKVLLGLEAFFFRDYGVLGYPFIHYHRECFWRGELPLWNPLSNCGAPFLAQWGTMVLYPPSLIYLVLPLPWSLGFFCLLHLFVAGLGMYHLARRWTDDDFAASVAGVAFVFNGVVFSCLLWPNYTAALGWMPWIVLATERAWREGGRAIVVAALLGALQMLSGVPELVVFTWVTVGALWLAGSRNSGTTAVPLKVSLLRLAIVGLLVAALAACQLLPFLDLLGSSHRTADTGGVRWAMPGWGWANLLVPLFHTFEGQQGVVFQHEQGFMTSYYPGIAILVLAIWGAWRVRSPRTAVLLALVITGYVLALGPHGKVFSWIKSVVPAIGFARFPVKFTLLATFALPLLAAFAIAKLQRERATGSARSLWIISAVCAVMVAALLWFAWSYPFPLQRWTDVWQNSVVRVLFLAIILGAGVCACGACQPKTRVLAMLSCILFLALDAITHTPQQNPTIASSNFVPGMWQYRFPGAPRPLRVAITPDAEERLLRSSITNATQDFLTKRLALWSNLNLLDSIAKVNGSSTLQLRHQKDVERRLYPTNALQMVTWSRGLLDFLGVTHLTGSNVSDWITHPTALPLVTCGQQPRFVSDAEALERVTSAEFEPRTQVYLPEGVRTQCAATGEGEAQIGSLKVGAQRISCIVECDRPTLVVVAQSQHANWKAHVGGVPVPVWRANYAFQSVQVPAGQHELVLEYRDGHFTAGGIISVLGLGACLLWWRRKWDVPAQESEPARSRTGEEFAADKVA
jgi:hypothetical protein